MKTCIWYHTAEQQPNESGYYLSCRGWGRGGKADGDSDVGYVYYDKKIDEWRDYEIAGHHAFVYYWTDAKPDQWVDDNELPVSLYAPRPSSKKAKPNPALDNAWQRVQDAVRDYELIKALTWQYE